MSWRDDFQKAAGVFGRAAGEALRSGAEVAGEWAESRADQRRVDEFDDNLNKAAARAKAAGRDGSHEPSRDQKAIGFDPFDLVAMMGWRERPSPLTYVAMDNIGTGVPVIADAIRARATQVQTFCQLPEDRHSPGLRVRPVDKSAKVTGAMRKRMQELEDLVLRCGYHENKETYEIGKLREFCGMFIRDSLTFDQACFEVVPDRSGNPSYFSIVDPSTIRLLDPVSPADTDEPFAIQTIQGTVVADFMTHELAFCIRNPRSGIRSFGYGQSEIETLVREITGFLWGIEYNRKFFSQGSTTKGILNFKGTVPDKHLQSFRRQWYAMVAGVENAFRTPITNADEIQWINMQMSSRDMEMSAWMDFLIKIVCARYQIAPEEVNFSYGNTGQSQAMGTAPIEEKLKASKDLGLRPLVYWFFDQLNKHFLQRIDPEYEVVAVGLDEKGVDAETDLLQKQTHVYLTVDEAREAVGLSALSDGRGDLILDPTWLQFVQGQEAQEEGEDYGGYGDEDEDAEAEDFGEDDAGAASADDFGLYDEDGDKLESSSAGFDDTDDNQVAKVAKSEQGSIELLTEPPSAVVRYTVDL